jgi:hypothetical protein
MALAELRARIQRGEAAGEDLVWRAGLSDWQPIGHQAELSQSLEASPPVLRVAPAPLSSKEEPPLFEVIQGGQAAAVARPSPRPASAPRPTPAARPAARPVPRWPMLTLAASGLVLVAAVVVVVAGRSGPASPTVAPVAVPAPVQTPEQEEPQEEPQAPATVPASSPTGTIAPLEIRARRQPRQPERRSPPAAAPPDAGADHDAPAAPFKRQDFGAATAARILRDNRGALAACDRLAERRGEKLEGISARFSVRVSSEGRVETTVEGEGISAALLSCYSSVASQFQAPLIGKPYRVTFRHMH